MRITSSLIAILLGLSLTGSAMAGDPFEAIDKATAKLQAEKNKVKNTRDSVQARADAVAALGEDEEPADNAAKKKKKKKKNGAE